MACRLENFEVELKSDGMHFTWKLRPVSSQELKTKQPAHYGIELAKILSFPTEIIGRALEVSNQVRSQTAVQGGSEVQCISGVGSLPQEQIYSLSQKLFCLATADLELQENQLMHEVASLKELLPHG